MAACGSLVQKQCGCGNKNISEGLNSKGIRVYKNRCRTCIRKATALKKGYCERCGKVPESSRQLETDHIDCDPSNNDPSNIQTLCSPCHREKTSKDRRDRRDSKNM